MNLVFENKDKLLNFIQSEEQGNRVCISPWTNRIKCILHKQDQAHNRGIEFIKYHNVEYKINLYNLDEIPQTGSYIIPVGLHESPDTWAGYEGRFPSIFSLINETYLRHLREGRAYLLLDNSLEGYHTEKLFDFLHDEAVRLNIPIENIIFICGNVQLDKRAQEWSDSTGKKCVKAFGYSHFEFDMLSNAENRAEDGNPLPSLDDQIEYKKQNLDKIKPFNFLNRKPRNHRAIFYTKLFHAKLLEQGFISMNPWLDETLHEGMNIDEYFEDPGRLEDAHRRLPISWDNSNNLENPNEKVNRFNDEVVLNSWLTIVSETHFNDKQGTVFLSEKTFKAIASYHPFIILGSKESLKELRKLGYYTFDRYIDESYDELDNIDRMDAIIKELYNIINRQDKLGPFEELRSKLIWNRKMLEYNCCFNPPAGFHYMTSL